MLRMPWDSTLQLPWRHRLPYRLPYRLPSPTCSITELMAVVAELRTAMAAAKAAAGAPPATEVQIRKPASGAGHQGHH